MNFFRFQWLSDNAISYSVLSQQHCLPGGRSNPRPLGVDLQRIYSTYRIDLLLAVCLAVLAGVASYQGSRLVDPVVLSLEAGDVWFDSDAIRVFDNMVSRYSSHERANLHPLFSLIAFPPVFILRHVVGLDPLVAVRVVICGVAALWMAVFYALLRLFGLRRLDSVIFCMLAGTSASAMFWFVLPETYPLGSVSILLALVIVAAGSYRQIGPAWSVAVNVLTLSFTITNWTVGLMATFAVQPWKRAVRLIVYAFCITTLLTCVQHYLFPSATFFFDLKRATDSETEFLGDDRAGGPVEKAQAFIFHSMVMPEIRFSDPYFKQQDWPMMRVQYSQPGSGTLWGVPTIGLWTLLLGLGAWALFTIERRSAVRVVLGFSILIQFALHLLYGRETFLFSLHFAPLLVVLAALGALTRWRSVVLVIAATLVITAGMNNGRQFRQAIDFFHTHRPPTHNVQQETELPPFELQPEHKWSPVLPLTNASGRVLAHVSPGGSFSPGQDSFGVSVGVIDRRNLVVTSDTLPAKSFWGVSQSLSWDLHGYAPSVRSGWYYYNIELFTKSGNLWKVALTKTNNFITELIWLIRSDGPSGGPIWTLDWDGHRLLINKQWELKFEPAPTAVQVGEKDVPGRLIEHSPHWESKHGRGYALVELGLESRQWNMTITRHFDGDSTTDNPKD